MTKVLILGTGRMGKQIAKRITFEEGMELVAAVDSPESPDLAKDIGVLAGVEPLNIFVESAENLGDVIKESKPDVAVDFTSPDACLQNLQAVAENKVNVVCGTTGLGEDQKEELIHILKNNKVGAVMSPNMSVGVNVFWKLVGDAAQKLRDYDIEIVESHHRFKKDSPSGTALKTAEIVNDVLETDMDETSVYGRRGEWVRNKGEVGIHAVRGGDIVGEHTVLYATIGERIEITHRAHSREAFVNGVVEAIRYVDGKKGVHGMNDVLGL
ncbi:4-hydroxy-tetrahydrodipicolinate reductase [Candidatus Altiarchaeota archaeon]